MNTALRFLPWVLMLCASLVYAEAELKVIDARIMITPPGVSVTAGLMTVVNETDSDIEISSITAQGFERVEMHKTEVVDGVARMRQEHELNVPAKDSLILKNGGYHMMLYTPERSFAEGDMIEITLITNQGKVTALVPVKRHFAN